MVGTSKQHEKSLFRPFLGLFLYPFEELPLIFNGAHSDYGIQMQNLVFGSPRKKVQISLFQGGGRGQDGYKNSLIIFFLIRGGGRGSEQIRTFS